jgi:hypothetical protein
MSVQQRGRKESRKVLEVERDRREFWVETSRGRRSDLQALDFFFD